jgi:hypothetical protein
MSDEPKDQNLDPPESECRLCGIELTNGDYCYECIKSI